MLESPPAKMLTPEFREHIAYNLILDATEASHRCHFFRRKLSRHPEKIGPLPEDLRYLYINQLFDRFSKQDPRAELKITQEIADNLTKGKPFNKKDLDPTKEFGLSYSPEAYRAFMNLFTHLHRQGKLYEEFASLTFLESGWTSYRYLGLVPEGEWGHLAKTNFQLPFNFLSDFTEEETVFMENKKIFTIASDAKELPKAQHGRPIVLLHGRFNGFLSLNYLEAIFSVVTSFPKPPCLVIGIDDDTSSIVLEKQAPFMDQVFRAGFYTFLPFVDGVFLASPEAYKDFNEYWGGVYADMEIDCLVLEENDPLFAKKKEGLEKSTNGKGNVLARKSDHLGTPRLSQRDIKSGDPQTTMANAAKWLQLSMNLFSRYFSGGKAGFNATVIDMGSETRPIQLPLVMK